MFERGVWGAEGLLGQRRWETRSGKGKGQAGEGGAATGTLTERLLNPKTQPGPRFGVTREKLLQRPQPHEEAWGAAKHQFFFKNIYFLIY